jgi:hypothetical protein
MKAKDRLLARGRSSVVVGTMALALAGSLDEAWADSCRLETVHGGIAFPVQHIPEDWACRLKFVIDHYTTANALGPLNTAMDASMYFHLLDHPPLAAALINRLDLADYKAEMRGPGRWWANDGEGTEGIVQLVYQERAIRVYYLEGTHRSRLLPNVSGKAVVFLRMGTVKEPSGHEAMENTLVAYTMLDNRVLSGLASLLRPLVGATVIRKLRKGIAVVNRLGLEIRQRPERVLFEATDPPPLPDEDVAFLKEALGGKGLPSMSGHSGRSTP